MRLVPFALCLLASAACRSVPDSAQASGSASGRAWLGAVTRTPSSSEAEAMELPFEVRLQGQAIASVVPGGPASLAGLKSGDVVLRMDENALYSQDDVRDFLCASQPGEKVELTVRRAGTSAEEALAVELTSSPDDHAATSIDWEFASLAQLSRATAKARAEKRRLLIGLSGAET